ncbi:alpha-glucosidase [Flavobacterium sp.]|uniref:glycoside hydrolase family 13 protein n=1 Tax=Flavobacterium sp. TaxID=239 RepID=UPI0037520313
MKKIISLTIVVFFLSCKENSKETLTTETSTIPGSTWWKEAVIYQLYPRSFQDTNGDGVGDIKGITQRLDYLQDLGINAIWLNPICASPNDDNGYDISDYKAIMTEMGSMEDFDEMLAGMKKRNIKLIMDLVINHSSDEHKWFTEAKKSRDNKYYNYYHWWPAEKGTPTKRYSLFDENADAWRFNKATNSYYLHYFSRKQPDLNWENPVLRQEMYDIMKFWLDKGVAGFRLDAFPFMAKDTSWPDKGKDFTNEQFVRYYGTDEKVHTYLKEMNEKVLSKYKEVYTVGEGGVIPFSKVQDYVNTERDELNTLYHDELGNIWGRDSLDLGVYDVKKHNVVGLKQIVTKWDEKFLNSGWNTVFWANHDQSRTVSRYGNEAPEYREASAKMLYTFLLTQRATPYLYNGDEIGMTNIRFKTVEEYNDLQTKNRYYIELRKSKAAADAYLLMQADLSRDNGRTPMQWNAATTNAGFTTGKPWLPINKNYVNVNVEQAEKDKNSILNYVRQMTKLRKEHKDILVYGKYQLIDKDNKNIFAYTRSNSKETFLILLNFTKEINTIAIPKEYKLSDELINNLNTLKTEGNNIKLQPYQSCIIKLK